MASHRSTNSQSGSVNIGSGSNNPINNSGGIHKCNYTACGKEFRLRAQLVRHVANSHSTGPTNVGTTGVSSQSAPVGGGPIRSGSPRPIMKTRAAFYFNSVPSLRLARRMCDDILNLRHAARFPFIPINTVSFKQECKSN